MKKKIIMISCIIMVVIIAAAAVHFYRELNVDYEQIVIPSWIEQDFLDINPYSRPGIENKRIKGIVVHYVANPGSTASQNRNYFNTLNEEKDTYASSHFIINLDGAVLQCIPLNEIAYASNSRNDDTISIECCHPDETGKFTEETYRSLVRLTSWLEETFHLKKAQIIRHYDITGKICPKYFVETEGAWEAFLEDVEAFREE